MADLLLYSMNPGHFVTDATDIFMIQENPQFYAYPYRIMASESTANSSKTSWRYEFCLHANFTH